MSVNVPLEHFMEYKKVDQKFTSTISLCSLYTACRLSTFSFQIIKTGLVDFFYKNHGIQTC